MEFSVKLQAYSPGKAAGPVPAWVIASRADGVRQETAVPCSFRGSMASGYRHRDFWRANVRPGLRGSILAQHQLLQGPHGRRPSTSTHSGGESKSRENRPMRPLAKRGDEASAGTEYPAGNALGSCRARHYPSGQIQRSSKLSETSVCSGATRRKRGALSILRRPWLSRLNEAA